MPGGQYVYELKTKAIWLRQGSWINHFSAMKVFDGKLVLGIGTGDNKATLMYADWDTITEQGDIDTDNNEFYANTITSQVLTKNFDLGMPDIYKKIKDIVVVSRNNEDWSSDQSYIIYYRMDEGTWTGIYSDPAAATPTTASHDGSASQTVTHEFPINSAPGYYIQLKFESAYAHEITRIIFYYNVLPKR